MISNPETRSLRYLGIGINVYYCLLATSFSAPVSLFQFPILGEDGRVFEEYGDY